MTDQPGLATPALDTTGGIAEADAVILTDKLSKRFAGAPAGAWRPPGGGPPGGGRPGGPGGPPGGGRPGGPPGGTGGGDGFLAVDSLDLRVRSGEVFGLLGPNGAGKTTTIGMLTTRVVPTSGRAVVAGVDVVGEPAVAKQFIGVVSQTNTLDRSLTVAQNLLFHGRYFGMSGREARQTTDELLEQFTLTEKSKAEVSSLSGGLAQRLMIARAIMHRPQVLFLDEPTTGLDPQSRLALWDTIRMLNGQGQTVLLTTHYMEEADQLCERLAIMDHGKILALDTPARLKADLGADTVVTLTIDGDLASLAPRLEVIASVTKVVADAQRQTVRVHSRGDSVLAELIAQTETGGNRITDINVTQPSLETVFINLTGKDLRE